MGGLAFLGSLGETSDNCTQGGIYACNKQLVLFGCNVHVRGARTIERCIGSQIDIFIMLFRCLRFTFYL